MRNRWMGHFVFVGTAMLMVLTFPGAPSKSADKSVNLDGATGNESVVSTNVVTTFPVKVKNKVTNKAVGQAFRFNWPSAGPGGFFSEAGNSSRPGTANGVGAVWTWDTTRTVFAFTGSTCTNDICFTRTFPTASTAPLGPFGVPGRSLTASNVTVTNESLTSSLLTFFSPETELFHVTSSVEQLGAGLFRYRTTFVNNTGSSIVINEAPSPLGCNSVCGDGVREGAEDCDGSSLGGTTCGTFGMAGTLHCDAGCHYDYSECHAATCPNGVREGFEQCDGTDLGGSDCTDFGAKGGTLGCDSECNYDFSGCLLYCGNNVIEGSETCDGTDVNDWSCSNLPESGGGTGFVLGGGSPAGSVSCTSQCDLDLSKCENVCGNGIAEPKAQTPEECDRFDLRGESCESLSKGTRHGLLDCGSDCFFDTNGCTCGDHVRNGFDQCDGTDFGGADCVTLGGTGGTLGCGEFCDYDLSNCTGICGNGVVDSASEECDGTDFQGETCVTQGGTEEGSKGLTCNYDCTINTSLCAGMCGNGVVNDGEECDGSDLDGATCDGKGSALRGAGLASRRHRGRDSRTSASSLGFENSPSCDFKCQLDFSTCNVPCDVPGSTNTVDAHDTTSRCEVSTHPAKEVAGQITVCGNEIPDGDPSCGTAAATEGTANYFVPDESVTIGDVFFSPLGVEIVEPGGNGRAEPGETIDFRVNLFNAGTVDAHNVTATLSIPPSDLDGDGTTDPAITILNGTGSYPDSCMRGFGSGSGDCTSAPTPVIPCANSPLFRISIPANFPVDVSPPFELSFSFTTPALAGSVRADAPAKRDDAGHARPVRPEGLSMVTNFVFGIGTEFCGNGQTRGTEQCDDGNNVDGDCCSSTCQFESLGSTCDDHQACTTGDRCNGQGSCTGTPNTCDDGNPCTIDACSPQNGSCSHPNAPDGTACSFNSTLAGLESSLDVCAQLASAGRCSAGQCVATSNQCPVGYVDADTTAKQGSPSSNYGTKGELEADDPPSANQAFVRFKLAGTSGQSISKVRLRLFALKSASSGGRIHKTTSCSWTETGLKWSNKPALGTPFVNIGPVVKGQRYDVDITSLLTLTGDGSYCVGIDNVSSDADYGSREAASGRPAILVETSCPCTKVDGQVTADATVVSTSANTNFGSDPYTGVDASPIKQTYVKVRVTGLGSYTVTSARLRLQVANISGSDADKGGQIRLVPSSQCGWNETNPGGITYNTRPTSAGSVLSSVGEVVAKQLVEFDLKSTITADGTYCYRLESTSTNGADYNSLQGPALRPELVLQVKP